ncbi:MAG: Crp/Fnr family transcriptional regulator [Oscillospiraceae bacterium]|jgi:CRP-like cAMP-binding protein|nr:Crp/Fnr family transcriptional regulator [Oscillospiraceae bacterium]
MDSAFKKSLLFSDMTDEEIRDCLICSGSEIITYEKDAPIFFQQDKPQKLFVLVEGSVAVCRDSVAGKRNIITTVSSPGDLFGEVFLFLNKNEYDNYAVAVNEARVLQMPKDFLYRSCSKNCRYHTMLISNMLLILAQKAYYLNQKLQIISSSTLRQKISKILIQHASEDGTVRLNMNREELADFLNVARPSLSRELMKMQEEGLLQIEKSKFKILNLIVLQNEL